MSLNGNHKLEGRHMYARGVPQVKRVPGLLGKPKEQEKWHTSLIESLHLLMHFDSYFEFCFSSFYVYV